MTKKRETDVQETFLDPQSTDTKPKAAKRPTTPDVVPPGNLQPMETITPALVPSVDTRALFRPMLQGSGTNRLTQISTRRSDPPVDTITGTATITEGNMTVFIERYDSLAGGLRVSTHKLLDAFTIALTAQNDYRGGGDPNTLVSIPLEEYMHQCGIPLTKASKDKTRRKIKEDLEALFNTSLQWSEPTGRGSGNTSRTYGQTQDYARMRIISFHGIRNGIMTVRFSPEIAAYLTHAYLMQYPVRLFRIDERNPSAYHIGKKLLLHHSIDNNQKKGTANTISVRALLDCAPDIPTYEEVNKKGRQLEQRIITPFENALNALDEMIHWEYCNAKGVALSEKQLESFGYATFIECYIHFEVLNAPSRTPQVDSKTRQASEK